MKRSAIATLAAGMAVGLALSNPGQAAEYPTKDIRVVVPWGAGGGTDAIIRKFMSLAEEPLSTTIYVENIEGGISAVGIQEVMGAPPDGYTLGGLTYDSVVTVPWQELVPGYDLAKLALICRITSEPDALIVPPDAPYQTLEDLIAAAKEAPGDITVGIQGLGSRTHVSMLQLQDATGTEFRLVSYPDGAGGQKEALLSGEVDVIITSLGDFAPLIESGEARGLVEFADARNPAFDVATTAEAGVDLQTGSFVVFAAPQGTPDDILQTLESAFKETFDGDAFQTWAADVGVTASWLGQEEVNAWAEQLKTETFAKMQALVDAGVIKK